MFRSRCQLSALHRHNRSHGIEFHGSHLNFSGRCGGLMISALDSGVRVLAGDIVLCSWTSHLTPTVPLSTQVYKWVPANLMLEGNPAMYWHPIQGEGGGGRRSTPSRFMPQKLEISAGLMAFQARSRLYQPTYLIRFRYVRGSHLSLVFQPTLQIYIHFRN